MTQPTVTVTDISTGTVQVITGGFIGPQGPQGPSGGPQGSQGPQGASGAQGAQGPVGPQGAPGIGTQGPQGADGPQGANGAQGAQGPTGPQGAQGAGGSAGVDGTQGPQGAIGPQGYQGPQGSAGPQGMVGPQGATGPQGGVGPQGYQGVPGDPGPQGFTGSQGPQGATGAQGSTGSQGPIGPQGPLGPQGATGAQGSIGPQGVQGGTGPQGFQGAIGPQGATGPSGGPQGSQGPSGRDGIIDVAHGLDGTIARPDAPIVYWIGPAVPLNAAPTDFWSGSSSDAPQSFGSTLALANAYTDQQISSINSAYVPTTQPAIGEFVPRRLSANAVTGVAVDGVLYGPVFKAEKTETIGSVTLYTGTTAAGATPTLARVGVYSINPLTQDCSLIAFTTNDTTLFSATNTAYTKVFSTTWNKVAGNYYFLSLLMKSGAAMPNFVGWVGPSPTVTEGILAVWPALSFKLTGQTDLPASISGAALTAGSINVPLFRLS